MKIDIILKSTFKIFFLIGVTINQAHAAKIKGEKCHTLTVENKSAFYDIQLNYAPCGDWGNPQYLPILHGKTSGSIKVEGESGFIVSKCNANGHCGQHDKITPILPHNPNPQDIPSIEKDYSVQCSGTYDNPSCISTPPYQ